MNSNYGLKMKSRIRTLLLSVLLLCFIVGMKAERRPVIGISDTHKDGTNAAVPRSYVNAVLLTGGIPVVIPLMYEENEMIALLNSLDGIIFTGGEDFDPSYYNEYPIPQMGTVNATRDKFDLTLLSLAAERGIPILGICRGIQLINIAFGGSLYQDLPAQYADKSIRHRQSQPNNEASHSVTVENHTVFADIVKDRMLMVNSSHHQAIKDVARGFRVAGKSSDNIVEVIEKIDNKNWILGVQFHPEMRVTRDVAMRNIFQQFMAETASRTKPNQTNRPLIASRPQNDRESSQELSYDNRAASTSTPQIIYKSVVDTQYIYKFIHDTLYVNVPADTVYISVPETKVTQVSDAVSLAHADNSTATNVVFDSPTSAQTVDTPVNESIHIVSDTLIYTSGATTTSSDTLIYTPGDATLATSTKKSEVSKSKKKREEKEKAKQDKQAAEKKAEQRRKEMQEKAKQNEKELKELKEKEKFEKKYAEAKEKQFNRQQKENAKLDKKELKAQQKKEKQNAKK